VDYDAFTRDAFGFDFETLMKVGGYSTSDIRRSSPTQVSATRG
jgi:hypothetical protein